MKRASVKEVKTHLEEFVETGQREPILVTRRGRPVAVLVPLEDKDELERPALAYTPRFRAILAESRQQIREGRAIPHDEFWRRVQAENPEYDIFREEPAEAEAPLT
jgi:prevent-host-death family protein